MEGAFQTLENHPETSAAYKNLLTTGHPTINWVSWCILIFGNVEARHHALRGDYRSDAPVAPDALPDVRMARKSKSRLDPANKQYLMVCNLVLRKLIDNIAYVPDGECRASRISAKDWFNERHF